MEHTLRLPPYLLNGPLNEAIKGELDSTFLDKVIEKLGLCVSVYDIQSIEGGFIFPGDGAQHTRFRNISRVSCLVLQSLKSAFYETFFFWLNLEVRFRLVMFRPYEGEVISAGLQESTKEGLRLSLGFFDDVYVPVPLLASPVHSEPDPRLKDSVTWIWEYDGQNYPIDGADEIRFRVHNVSYPPIPLEQGEASDKKAVKPFAPMGSLDGDGLGPVSWWV